MANPKPKPIRSQERFEQLTTQVLSLAQASLKVFREPLYLWPQFAYPCTVINQESDPPRALPGSRSCMPAPTRSRRGVDEMRPQLPDNP